MAQRWNIERVRKLIESFNCKLLSTEYINTLTPLIIQCECGKIFKRPLKTIVRKTAICKCDECTKFYSNQSKRTSCDDIKKYLETFGYELISTECKNNHELLEMKCDKGHIFKMKFTKFYHRGHRCPHCKESKGERAILNILEKYKENYIHQYIFNDCKFKQPLRFDFYLPKYNCCIEFDGEQHFKIMDWFGGLDGFINTKIRDTIKNEYCKSNDIELIRISYLEIEDIENILIKKLRLNKI